MDGLRCLGYQQFTAGTIDTAQALTVPEGTAEVWLQAETQNIRLRFDATNPTTAIGMLLSTTAPLPLIYNGSPGAIRAISAVAGGVLNVSYFGR